MKRFTVPLFTLLLTVVLIYTSYQSNPTLLSFSLTAILLLSLAWQLFRRQYFRAMDLHYWHPGEKERARALRGSGAGAAME